ncbi:carbon-nitrogen hydrolase family protein [Devosia sp.]|uniref:carbon-nitrogen hydrolase family protein n=1 Tax=Devosia sp. TaxID=1871048 RepID=UPI0032632FD2
MKIAAVQMRSTPDPEVNIVAVEIAVAEAAKVGAGYVLTPEVTMAFTANRGALEQVAGPYENNPYLARVAALAKRHAIHLHIGSLAVALPDGRFANRSVLFAPDGAVVALYDKIHLFDASVAGANDYRESDTYRGGDRAVTAPVGDFTLGLAICYDMRFPALFNGLASAGANLLSMPAAFTVPTGQAHWEVLLRARAIETGSYVIAAAQGGHHENGRATYGHSMIIDPWGKIIARIEGDEPGIITAEISIDAVTEARRRIPALANARPFALK